MTALQNERLERERIQSARKEKILQRHEEEIRLLKSKIEATEKLQQQQSTRLPKERTPKDRSPSTTSDDASLVSENKSLLPSRKTRPLLSFSNVVESDDPDSASEAPSNSKRRPRAVCCMLLPIFLHMTCCRSSRGKSRRLRPSETTSSIRNVPTR
jgi:hypothetical protein